VSSHKSLKRLSFHIPQPCVTSPSIIVHCGQSSRELSSDPTIWLHNLIVMQQYHIVLVHKGSKLYETVYSFPQRTEQDGVAVTFYSFIWQTSGLNLCWVTSYLTKVSLWFSSVSPDKCSDSILKQAQLSPFKSSPTLHYHIPILFDIWNLWTWCSLIKITNQSFSIFQNVLPLQTL
jgi:hypothetical protein